MWNPGAEGGDVLAWSPSEAHLHLISTYFDAPRSSLTPLLPLALSQVQPAKLQDWVPQTAELPVLSHS